jgi:hypothetical protein
MNIKFKRGEFRDVSRRDVPIGGELRGYRMEADYVRPEDGMQFKQITLITDSKGPLFSLDSHCVVCKFMADGVEPYPDVTFMLTNTSYSPGIDAHLSYLESKYGTWDERVLRRLRRHNFVYLFKGYQPRKGWPLP